MSSYFMWRNLNELDKIDPFNRAAPEVLATRLAIYHGLAKWELMQEIAKRLAEFQPDDVQWTISLAYATRRADSDSSSEGDSSPQPVFTYKKRLKKMRRLIVISSRSGIQSHCTVSRKACRNRRFT